MFMPPMAKPAMPLHRALCPTFQISDIVTESFDCTKLQSTANGIESGLAIKISQTGERQAKIK